MHCPNADCPFRRKFGYPAEYRADFSACSDCGAALVEGPGVEATRPAPAAKGDGARWAVTLAVASLALVGSFVPLPFAGPADAAPFSSGSLLAFGLTPFTTAFVLVEVVALLVPGLRARRVGADTSRAPLTTAAWALGLAFLAVQLAATHTWATSASLFDPHRSSSSTTALLGLAHVGLAALVWVAETRGVGAGFATVLLGTGLAAWVRAFSRLAHAVNAETMALGPALMLLAVTAAPAVVVLVLGRRSSPTSRTERPTALVVPVSGFVPLLLAGSMLGTGLSLLSARTPFGELSRTVISSPWLYHGLFLMLVLDLALVLGWLFARPKTIAEVWARWHPGVDAAAIQARARALLPGALAIACGVLGGAAIVGAIAPKVWQFSLGLTALEVALPLVLLDEFLRHWEERRAAGALVRVRNVHRVVEVEPLVQRLRDASIPVVVLGLRARALFHFFAPYLPIQLWVPAAQAETARQLVAQD